MDIRAGKIFKLKRPEYLGSDGENKLIETSALHELNITRFCDRFSVVTRAN